MEEDSAERIGSIRGRRILNSHVGLTNEFVIELESGGIGVGASPQGETISVCEDASTRSDVEAITREIRDAPLLLLTTFHWRDDRVIREERLHLTDRKQSSF